jgi:hypothetical protein
MLNLFILSFLMGIMYALGHHTAKKAALHEVQGLRIANEVLRIAKDDAERAFFIYKTDPANINWEDPKTKAGLDRTMAEIDNMILMEDIAKYNEEKNR